MAIVWRVPPGSLGKTQKGYIVSNEYPEIPADLLPKVDAFGGPPKPKPQRMTNAQRDKLWDLCGRYGVPFREDDYHPAIFNNGMVEGWIGGEEYRSQPNNSEYKKTIYIGVEPNGDSHS